jgi:(p)ppGpp synthase/HD superfamily hydrolase
MAANGGMVERLVFTRRRKVDYLISAAIDIAKRAHAEQVRKYTGEPYISHPFAVAGLVASVSDDDDMIIASILHDTVEDTSVTLDLIAGIFGITISSLVSDLTDISCKNDGNRAVRKAIDREHTSKASAKAKTIKLADLIDNSKTIIPLAPKFAEVYMAEKKQLLEVLSEGDKRLYSLASNMVNCYYNKL